MARFALSFWQVERFHDHATANEVGISLDSVLGLSVPSGNELEAVCSIVHARTVRRLPALPPVARIHLERKSTSSYIEQNSRGFSRMLACQTARKRILRFETTVMIARRGSDHCGDGHTLPRRPLRNSLRDESYGRGSTFLLENAQACRLRILEIASKSSTRIGAEVWVFGRHGLLNASPGPAERARAQPAEHFS